MTCNCEHCAWTEFEQAVDMAKVKLSTRCEYEQHGRCTNAGECECPCHQPSSRFDTAWTTAPPTRRHLTMREDAEYWFLRGRQWGMSEALEQSNADLKQLLKENINAH